MKYYLDKADNAVFKITNFEYFPRENRDIEITEEEYNNFVQSNTKEPTLEEKLSELRIKRKYLLNAFDKWEKAVIRGREIDSPEIMDWYQNLLDLKEEAFEDIPERIKYYL